MVPQDKLNLQTFPPDVLLEIFSHCLPSDDSLPRPSIHTAPVNLGRICSLWRRVALDSSPLWCRLRIGGDGNDAVDARPRTMQDLQALQEFLVRSKSVPVSLALRLACFSVEDRQAADMLLREAILHRLRWRSLELHATGAMFDPVLKAITEGVPLLESLRIHDVRMKDMSSLWTTTVALDLRHAPRLSSLVLLNNPYMFILPESTHTNLVELEVPYCGSITELFHQLTLCPNLKSLDLHVDVLAPSRMALPPADDPEAHQIKLVHRNITCLRLHLDYTYDPLHAFTLRAIMEFFDTIELPALEILSADIYIDTRNYMRIFGERLVQFVSRVSPPLRVLSLMGYCVGAGTFIELLKLAPTLEEITTKVVPNGEAVVKALTLTSSQDSDDTPLCPKLRKVAIWNDEPIEPDSIIQMISSRSVDPETIHEAIDENDAVSVPHSIASQFLRLEEFYAHFATEQLQTILRDPKITCLVSGGLRIGSET